jgi:putative pyruvate formate lyase activating enzyme
MTLEDIVGEVISFLDRGCKSVGFVSPSHVIPQVKMIIEGIRESGYNPVFVYNSNGYDRVEELQGLEAYIDVYLPDFKYADPVLSKEYSGVEDYPVRAIAALKEMYRQKGSTLILDEFGQVEKGMVIRHLVLPGSISNSFQVLEIIAEKLSTSMAISLMSQYYPTPDVRKHEKLGRTLYPEEYERVVEKMDELGFYKGWMQEPGSKDHYRPDFEQLHPFE